MLPQAIETYRRLSTSRPIGSTRTSISASRSTRWAQLDEARAEFLAAVQLDPLNGISRYNLGCVLEEQGEIDEAIEHLRRAARAMPAHADVHFNLALAYEKRGERSPRPRAVGALSALRPQRSLGRAGSRSIEAIFIEPQTLRPDSLPASALGSPFGSAGFEVGLPGSISTSGSFRSGRAASETSGERPSRFVRTRFGVLLFLNAARW